MAKKNTPAWQQVVLIALENVPKAKNGQEAWAELNAEEQTAVMDFLAEYCGGDAQAALEESCGRVKRGLGWQRSWGLLIGVCILAALWAALFWLESLHDMFHAYMWIVISLRQTIKAWNGDRHARMQTIWREHVDTHYGTTLALQDMYKTTEKAKELLRSKADFIFWGVSTILWISLTLWNYLT